LKKTKFLEFKIPPMFSKLAIESLIK